MRVSRRQFLAAAALPQFSTTLKVVNLFATAADRRGHPVTDLTRADFVLEEDGRRQEVRYFSAEREAPLTVGLLIDTSGTTHMVQPAERDAAGRFFRQAMRLDRDRGFVVQFDSWVCVLEELTGDAAALERATASAGGPGRAGREIRPEGRRGRLGTTLLYDAVAAVAQQLVAPQPGLKAVVVLSDGRDLGSATTLAEAVEAAQRADLMIYSILFEARPLRTASYPLPPRLPFPRPSPLPLPRPPRTRPRHGAYVLQSLSEPTGGRYFEATPKLDLAAVFARIEDDLRHQYSLGYTPDPPPTVPGFRRIGLTTGRRGVRVRTRAGYYAA